MTAQHSKMKSLSDSTRFIAKILTRRHQTLALAESCTGGLLAVEVTSISGASKFFKGGVVSYANSAKHDVLGVSEKTLKNLGPVSEDTALEMARGARKKLKTTWAISVTGIAGPSGGTRKKPVGLVYCALVGPKVEVVKENRFKGDRRKIQKSAARVAMMLLVDELKV
jgi:PncC family amidohydrolase